MTTTDYTGDTPILNVRIPEGRTLDGIDYGAHVSKPGWTGYYVRPAGSALPAMIARQTPAADELVGDDTEIAEAIESEILERSTTAERVAAAFNGDGQRFTHPVSGDELGDYCERMGATVEVWRPDPASPDDDAPDLFFAGRRRLSEDGPVVIGGIMSGDRIRYLFPDGSAIVIAGECWDLEGDEPGSWLGD